MVRHQRRKVFERNRPACVVCELSPLEGTVPSEVLLPPMASQEPWFSRFGDKIIALDCESVQKPVGSSDDFTTQVSSTGFVRFRFKPGTQKRYRSEAATVGLAWADGRRKTYRIKHPKDSYMVNRHTIGINGFQRNSLVDGESLENVTKKILAEFEDHLIVTHTGASDFSALGLCVGDFTNQWFDITMLFKRKDGSSYGLKKIYDYYYPDTKFQDGHHEAVEDAAATLKLFNVCKDLCIKNRVLGQTMAYYMSESFELLEHDVFDDDLFS